MSASVWGRQTAGKLPSEEGAEEECCEVGTDQLGVTAPAHDWEASNKRGRQLVEANSVWNPRARAGSALSPCAHICTGRKAVLWLTDARESLMTEKGSVQPMSWAQSSPSHVVWSLLSPGWAVILTGTGCKVLIKSEQKNRFLEALSPLCWSSLLPYTSPASSPFCTPTMFPICLHAFSLTLPK